MWGLWLAVATALLTIVIVYFSLFKILRSLYQKHFAWFVASLIILSPFAFVLLQARDLLELLWMLLLTPFYSVLVLFAMSPLWIVRFYCLAFSVLMIIQFLLQRGKPVSEPKSNDKFELFLALHLKERVHFVAKGKKKDNVIVRKGRVLVHGFWKCRSFILAIVLLSTLTPIFASNSAFRNPTYFEAQQFVASDKTASHTYVIGSYTCVNFAADFRSNALKAGYECGVVVLYYPDDSSHELNCFNTTDKGLVFVEPQWDKFVNVTVGEPYLTEFYNCTVVRYYIDWQMSS